MLQTDGYGEPSALTAQVYADLFSALRVNARWDGYSTTKDKPGERRWSC